MGSVGVKTTYGLPVWIFKKGLSRDYKLFQESFTTKLKHEFTRVLIDRYLLSRRSHAKMVFRQPPDSKESDIKF